MKGIILHGGHGTRLRPLTHTGPKQLLPIANKPMSQYCVESIKNVGIDEIAIIIGGIGADKVKEYYGTGEDFGVKFTYISQDYPKGIAHAIQLCEDFVDNKKFLVFLGDNIIQKNIEQIGKKFEYSDADASILLCEVDNPSRFGIADVKDGQILKIMEKPKEPPTNLAVTGIYFLTPKIFEIIKRVKPSWRNELEITDALQMLLEEGNKITYDIITDYWKDTGTPEDIINANKEILKNMKSSNKGKKEENVSINGNVIIGSGTIIKKNCQIIGPVIIGNNCILEENASIGPNASIGNNTKIAKSHIADSIIMENCEIMTDIKIKNSIISANSKIFQAENEEKILLLGEGTNIKI
ncbi:glucose-1-phosphate thymidylyltransferase [Candidatus Nitrosopumilus salaria BD31]|uniref:Glucose-1-phosphate thymidylyltransferase n=1 Tax=Candidatus Nitrosopumilus salarius BD31 TaxID=859350 RepID=I3D5B6_9ARCH|nr:glucose-1-phosphate thymidylyltransferase [Candidatus Nitrosopumilus salaria]EIJ66909.1 glucose-1-phosphate thymidylyltransferase [Candidatus Nitrosopumilus salaria BD31]